MIALQVQQFRDISRRSIFAKLAPFPNSLGPLFDRDLLQSFGWLFLPYFKPWPWPYQHF